MKKFLLPALLLLFCFGEVSAQFSHSTNTLISQCDQSLPEYQNDTKCWDNGLELNRANYFLNEGIWTQSYYNSFSPTLVNRFEDNAMLADWRVDMGFDASDYPEDYGAFVEAVLSSQFADFADESKFTVVGVVGQNGKVGNYSIDLPQIALGDTVRFFTIIHNNAPERIYDQDGNDIPNSDDAIEYRVTSQNVFSSGDELEFSITPSSGGTQYYTVPGQIPDGLKLVPETMWQGQRVIDGEKTYFNLSQINQPDKCNTWATEDVLVMPCMNGIEAFYFDYKVVESTQSYEPAEACEEINYTADLGLSKTLKGTESGDEILSPGEMVVFQLNSRLLTFQAETGESFDGRKKITDEFPDELEFVAAYPILSTNSSAFNGLSSLPSGYEPTGLFDLADSSTWASSPGQLDMEECETNLENTSCIRFYADTLAGKGGLITQDLNNLELLNTSAVYLVFRLKSDLSDIPTTLCNDAHGQGWIYNYGGVEEKVVYESIDAPVCLATSNYAGGSPKIFDTCPPNSFNNTPDENGHCQCQYADDGSTPGVIIPDTAGFTCPTVDTPDCGNCQPLEDNTCPPMGTIATVEGQTAPVCDYISGDEICLSGPDGTVPEACLCPNGDAMVQLPTGDWVCECPNGDMPIDPDGDGTYECPDCGNCQPLEDNTCPPTGTIAMVEGQPAPVCDYISGDEICLSGPDGTVPEACLCPNGDAMVQLPTGDWVCECPNGDMPIDPDGDGTYECPVAPTCSVTDYPGLSEGDLTTEEGNCVCASTLAAPTQLTNEFGDEYYTCDPFVDTLVAKAATTTDGDTTVTDGEVVTYTVTISGLPTTVNGEPYTTFTLQDDLQTYGLTWGDTDPTVLTTGVTVTANVPPSGSQVIFTVSNLNGATEVKFVFDAIVDGDAVPADGQICNDIHIDETQNENIELICVPDPACLTYDNTPTPPPVTCDIYETAGQDYNGDGLIGCCPDGSTPTDTDDDGVFECPTDNECPYQDEMEEGLLGEDCKCIETGNDPVVDSETGELTCPTGNECPYQDEMDEGLLGEDCKCLESGNDPVEDPETGELTCPTGNECPYQDEMDEGLLDEECRCLSGGNSPTIDPLTGDYICPDSTCEHGDVVYIDETDEYVCPCEDGKEVVVISTNPNVYECIPSVVPPTNTITLSKEAQSTTSQIINEQEQHEVVYTIEIEANVAEPITDLSFIDTADYQVITSTTDTSYTTSPVATGDQITLTNSGLSTLNSTGSLTLTIVTQVTEVHMDNIACNQIGTAEDSTVAVTAGDTDVTVTVEHTNDSASCITLTPPDSQTPPVTVQKQAASDFVTAGGTVTYTLTVTNTSDQNLTDVTITDQFVSGIDGLVTGSVSGASIETSNDNTVQFTIDSLAPGASTITYQVNIADSLTAGNCSVENQIILINVAGYETPIAPNVTECVELPPAEADIQLQKRALTQTALSGETLSFEIEVTATQTTTETITIVEPLLGHFAATDLDTDDFTFNEDCSAYGQAAGCFTSTLSMSDDSDLSQTLTFDVEYTGGISSSCINNTVYGYVGDLMLDDSASACVAPASPITVTKTAAPFVGTTVTTDPIGAPGFNSEDAYAESILYTITVTNSSAAAVDVTLTDQLDQLVTYGGEFGNSGATITPNTANNSITITTNVGADSSQDIKFFVNVIDDEDIADALCAAGYEISNTVFASTGGFTVSDESNTLTLEGCDDSEADTCPWDPNMPAGSEDCYCAYDDSLYALDPLCEQCEHNPALLAGDDDCEPVIIDPQPESCDGTGQTEIDGQCVCEDYYLYDEVTEECVLSCSDFDDVVESADGTTCVEACPDDPTGTLPIDSDQCQNCPTGQSLFADADENYECAEYCPGNPSLPAEDTACNDETIPDGPGPSPDTLYNANICMNVQNYDAPQCRGIEVAPGTAGYANYLQCLQTTTDDATCEANWAIANGYTSCEDDCTNNDYPDAPGGSGGGDGNPTYTPPVACDEWCPDCPYSDMKIEKYVCADQDASGACTQWFNDDIAIVTPGEHIRYMAVASLTLQLKDDTGLARDLTEFGIAIYDAPVSTDKGYTNGPVGISNFIDRSQVGVATTDINSLTLAADNSRNWFYQTVESVDESYVAKAFILEFTPDQITELETEAMNNPDGTVDFTAVVEYQMDAGLYDAHNIANNLVNVAFGSAYYEMNVSEGDAYYNEEHAGKGYITSVRTDDSRPLCEADYIIANEFSIDDSEDVAGTAVVHLVRPTVSAQGNLATQATQADTGSYALVEYTQVDEDGTADYYGDDIVNVTGDSSVTGDSYTEQDQDSAYEVTGVTMTAINGAYVAASTTATIQLDQVNATDYTFEGETGESDVLYYTGTDTVYFNGDITLDRPMTLIFDDSVDLYFGSNGASGGADESVTFSQPVAIVIMDIDGSDPSGTNEQGKIHIGKDVTLLDNIVLMNLDPGGQIVSAGPGPATKQLFVGGLLKGNLSDLLDERTYIGTMSSSGYMDFEPAIVIAVTNQILQTPPPLLEELLGASWTQATN